MYVLKFQLHLNYIFFCHRIRLAGEEAPFENSSATNIQRLFRGTQVRIDIKFKRYLLI